MKAKATKKSDAEKKRDRDELEEAAKKKKKVMDTIEEVPSAPSGGAPLKTYVDPHGCWSCLTQPRRIIF